LTLEEPPLIVRMRGLADFICTSSVSRQKDALTL
jgi:hypothetical protein